MKNLSAFWAAAAGVAVGIVLFAVLGAGTIEDSGIFQSLKLGGKTNLISDDGAALTYNGTHYQISSGTLTNASTNAFTGAGLIVLQSAVPANQTNVAAANPTATVSTSAVNGTAGTFMRSDASPAIPAAFIQANQTNDGTANWSASGTTNSFLPGVANVYGITLPTDNVADIGTSSVRLHNLYARTALWSPNVGSYTGDDYTLYAGGTGRIFISGSTGHAQALSNGAYDWGVSGGAFRNGWFTGQVSAGSVVTAGLTNTGVTVHTPSAIQSLSTNSTIAVDASTLRVTGNGAAVTLTNLPSIATNSIADGTVITVRGTSDSNTVTLQDYRTLTGTCLAMEVATVTLKNGSEMRFQWSAGNQRWQAMAFSANSSQNHPFKDATATGWFTSSAYDYNAPATLTPVDAGVSIDFGAANRLASITLTGAVTFAFANQTAGRVYELFIMGCSTNSPITWPTVSGVFPAGVYPSVAAAGKWHHLKFTCITSSVTTNIYIDGSTSN